MDPSRFLQALQENGVCFFTGVPDSLLKEFCKCITVTLPTTHHVIAANEGAAFALAVGYHIGTGEYGCVYLQNSGIGNLVNPLTSLADPEIYSIPLLMIIGWRGEPGVKDEPQHVKQGRVTQAMLDSMEVPFAVVDKDTDANEALSDLLHIMRAESRPVALLVRSGAFEPFVSEKETSPQGGELPSREEAIEAITEVLSEESVIIATTGFTSRELYELRIKKGQTATKDFLAIGGMGHAASIAMGVAIGQPDREVVCLDGDGSVLMHMGTLPIIGQAAPKNLIHIILNNGVHDSVGAQPTAGLSIDLEGIAKASGYRHVFRADSCASAQAALREAACLGGPVFIELRVRPGARKNLGRPKSTPLENKQSLMLQIGSN